MADGVIGWDAVLEGHLAAEQCKVLASARIGMAGAGGLGSNCAVFLARTGIRDFVIADPDVVALSNLNRQHFFPRHLGLPKGAALGAVYYFLIHPHIYIHFHPFSAFLFANRFQFYGIFAQHLTFDFVQPILSSLPKVSMNRIVLGAVRLYNQQRSV